MCSCGIAHSCKISTPYLGCWQFVRLGGVRIGRICRIGHIGRIGRVGRIGLILSKCGEIVCGEWIKTAIIRPNILLDEFILMPNQIHGIIVITGVSAKC